VHIFSSHVEYLADYLKPSCGDDRLRELYTFPIWGPLKKYGNYVGDANVPQWMSDLVKNCDSDNGDHVAPTLELRRRIPAVIRETDRDLKLEKIAEWIIREWGGIPVGNNLGEHVKKAEDSHKASKGRFEFERIASWSKFMAFKYPEDYAIYDARVVYSLNWLLFCNGSTKFFPPLEGRNSVMGLLDYRLKLLLTRHSKDDVLIKLNERKGARTHFLSELDEAVFMKKVDAYSAYCALLKEVANRLYPKDDFLSLTKIEMILFSIADRDIAINVLEEWPN